MNEPRPSSKEQSSKEELSNFDSNDSAAECRLERAARGDGIPWLRTVLAIFDASILRPFDRNRRCVQRDKWRRAY
jgi:hypothetical protein